MANPNTPSVRIQYRLARELMALAFAEDQAALYTASFEVICSHPYIQHQMQILANESQRQLLQLLDRAVSGDCATHVENEVAEEMKALLQSDRLSNLQDLETVQVALVLQSYLIAKYRKVIGLAVKTNNHQLETLLREMCQAKASRAKVLEANCLPISSQKWEWAVRIPRFQLRSLTARYRLRRALALHD